MEFAPVVLFVYNRPWHTRQTVEALLANPEAIGTSLYIFSDASRTAEDEGLVRDVRSYLRTITGFSSITVAERQSNLGLAASIIDGVGKICEEHGRVIVLEDDLQTSPHFLDFMNHALDCYENEERVISVAGYSYPMNHRIQQSSYFLRGTNCWGWATWKRGWRTFEPDGYRLLTQLYRRRLTRQFDVNGSYPYTNMLKAQATGKLNSWAIRWHASAFLADLLTLMPRESLVRNIGLDGSGVNCSCVEPNPYEVRLASKRVPVERISIREETEVTRSLETYFRNSRKALMWSHVLHPGQSANRLMSIFRKKFSAQHRTS